MRREERIREERAQLWLVLMYVALAALMTWLGGVHAWRARGARLGTWRGGTWE